MNIEALSPTDEQEHGLVGPTFLQEFSFLVLVVLLRRCMDAHLSSSTVFPEAFWDNPMLLTLLPGSGQEVTQYDVRILSREILKQNKTEFRVLQTEEPVGSPGP